MKGAYHHLRWIDKIVMQSGNLTRPKSACPMRLLQLTSKTRLVAGDASECEETILKLTRQKGTVLRIFGRLSLGVQQPLYLLDDFIAMGQEQLEKFDVRVKRQMARTSCSWPLFRFRKRMNRFAHHNTPMIRKPNTEWPLSVERPGGVSEQNSG
jgi:hypothetical protein